MLFSRKYFPKIWQVTKTALEFVSKILSNSSSGTSRNGVAELIPAPLTRTYRDPINGTERKNSKRSMRIDWLVRVKSEGYEDACPEETTISNDQS